MIIWGSYVMKKTLKKGDFHCPNCKNQRPYYHFLPRKWGHLYWIPLIPMESFDSYVECGKCNNKYRDVVLQYDPIGDKKKADASLCKLIGQTMVLIATSSNQPPTPDKVAATMTQLLGIEPEPMVLADSLRVVDRQTALEHIRQNSAGLTTAGKETLFCNAMSGLALSDATWSNASEIGASLGLTPAHVEGIWLSIAKNAVSPTAPANAP